MRRARYLCLLSVCLAALAGCATKDYVSTAPKNLTLRAEVESAGLFGVPKSVQLSVYRIGNTCPVEYLGSVWLDEKPVQIGLETGHKLYLKINFVSSGKYGSKTMAWGVVITPRAGAQYVASVRYADHMYEARVQEIGKGGAVVREFERQGLPCPEDD